jgi:hypothetical protein
MNARFIRSWSEIVEYSNRVPREQSMQTVHTREALPEDPVDTQRDAGAETHRLFEGYSAGNLHSS